jgi:hypothetical protein
MHRDKTDRSNKHTHDNSLSWLDTGTSIKNGGIKQVFLSWLGAGTSIKKISGRANLILWTQIFSEMMRSCKYLPHVSTLYAQFIYIFVLYFGIVDCGIFENVFLKNKISHIYITSV